MTAKRYDTCAKCGATTKQAPELAFHRFPLPSKRHGLLKAKVWAMFCFPNEDWTSEQSLKTLHVQHKMLCGNHFDGSAYTSSHKTRLNKFAIPSDAQGILHQLRNEHLNSSVKAQAVLQIQSPAAVQMEVGVQTSTSQCSSFIESDQNLDNKYLKGNSAENMSISNRRCAKCGRTRAEDMTVTYHRFPNPGMSNLMKARAWATYCWPEKDWSSIEALHSLYVTNKVLCGRHFKSTQFYDDQRQKLSIFAVPDSTEDDDPLEATLTDLPTLIELTKKSYGVDTRVNTSNDPVRGPKCLKRAPSTTSEIDIELDHVPDERFVTEYVSALEQPEEISKYYKESTHESIVPAANIYSWQKTGEMVPDQLDDVPDMLMYCEDDDGALDDNTDKEDSMEHEGFRCDVCDKSITGFRYTCVQCSDFDLCCACENNRAHQQHYVLRIPAPRPAAEVQFVLATIRRHLINRLDTRIVQDRDDVISVKSEVKSENEDNDDQQKPTPGHESDSSETSATESPKGAQRELSTDQLPTETDSKNIRKVLLNTRVDAQKSESESLEEEHHVLRTDSQHNREKLRTNRRKMLMKKRVDAQESDSESLEEEPHVLSTYSQNSREKLRRSRRKMLMKTRVDAQESDSESLEEEQHVLRTDSQHRKDKSPTKEMRGTGMATTRVYTKKHVSHVGEQDVLNTATLSTLPAPPTTAKRKISLNKFEDLVNLTDNSTSAKKICIRPLPNTTLSGIIPRLLSQSTGLINPYVKLNITRLPPGAIVKPVPKVALRPPNDETKEHNENNR